MSLQRLRVVCLLALLLSVSACQSPSLPTAVVPASTPVAPATRTPEITNTATAPPPATPAPEVVVEVPVTVTGLPAIGATAAVTSTAMPDVSPAPQTHVVVLGETLSGIAADYGVSVAALVTANDMTDEDGIWENQTLTIPVSESGDVPAVTPTPPLEANRELPGTSLSTRVPLTVTLATRPADWPPSRTDASSESYPLTGYSPSGSVRIHYQPDTYPYATMDTLAPMLDQILLGLQQQIGKFLNRPVDVYLAGTLFEHNPALQGLSISREYRTTVLVNGAFHQGEEYYILGHELTHIAAVNLLGHASSTMVHEGLATYLPQKYLVQDAGYLPIYEICAAAQQADAFVPARTLIQFAYDPQEYNGHIRTFFHYNLAGCFVGYLIERFGMEKMDQLYDSGAYYTVYGMTLGELDEAWQQWLSGIEVTVDAQAFVDMVNSVTAAYRQYLRASTDSYHANYQAYLHLNRARLKTNQGNLVEAQAELDQFWTLFGS